MAEGTSDDDARPAPAGRVRTWLSWSSGKDSAYTLARLRSSTTHEVTGLLTTVTDRYDRVSMHGVRTELLEAQARAVGLPLHDVRIPSPCPNGVYEERMAAAVETARRAGVGAMAFGDLFLEDIRAYRIEKLRPTGMTPIFPLFGMPTDRLAREMIAARLRAILVCVDPRRLDRRFAGREFDAELLEALPPGVDPCGENGEFHTFVYDGPGFAAPIPIRRGEVVERDGFIFADLLLDRPGRGPGAPARGGPR